MLGCELWGLAMMCVLHQHENAAGGYMNGTYLLGKIKTYHDRYVLSR